MKKAILCLLFLFPFIMLHADLFDSSSSPELVSHTYRAHGFNPFTGNDYNAIVTITQNRETYTIQWFFDDGSTDIGTGVRQGDHFSFVFVNAANPTDLSLTGVQSYEIRGNGRLRGPWTLFGSNLEGSEKLIRIN